MSCPPGYIRRKSFTRKHKSGIVQSGYTVRRKGQIYSVHPTTKSVYIPSTCVKMPLKKGSAKIGKLRKGDLIKYGYQYRLADRLRHKALHKAIEAYGILSVYHKLDAITKLSVRVAPDASNIFGKDRKWVQLQMK